MTERQPLSESLEIRLWDEPTSQRRNPDDCRYLYLGWLPRIGPTATVLYVALTEGLRAVLALGFEGEAAAFTMPSAELAASIGVGSSLRATAPLPNAVTRLVHFRLARLVTDRLEVRPVPPALTLEQYRQLPPPSQQALRVLGRAPVALG